MNIMRLVRNLDPVTQILIYLNLAGYIYNLYINGFDAITNLDAAEMSAVGGAGEGSPFWTAFTAMFMHGSLTHMLFNMVTLGAVGSIAGRFFDARTYLGTYLASGLIANFNSMEFLHQTVVVGASGAIFGIMGMLLIGTFFRPGLSDMKGIIIMLVIINVVLSFTGYRINELVHITGLSTGVIIASVIALLTRKTSGI